MKKQKDKSSVTLNGIQLRHPDGRPLLASDLKVGQVVEVDLEGIVKIIPTEKEYR